MSLPRYSFAIEGSRNFLAAAAEAQGEVLEPFFESPEWEYSPNIFRTLPALAQKRVPTAAFGVGEAVIVFLGFIGTCFAKKIFDEVYERTAKRPIGALLDSFFNKASIPSGIAVEYRDVIYLEDIDLVVVIRVRTEKDHTGTVLPQVMQAHRVAHAYIEQHGRKAPIHCHKVAAGLVSIEPELFNTMQEIKRHDKAQLRSLRRR